MPEFQTTIPASPKGIWTRALDFVAGPAKIIFQTGEATWNYTEQDECSADGDLSSLLNSKHCILSEAPVGALIGKIGGSSAGLKDGKKRFIVGRFCLVEIDGETCGPLFLTINDELIGLKNNSGELRVTITIEPTSGKGTHLKDKDGTSQDATE